MYVSPPGPVEHERETDALLLPLQGGGRLAQRAGRGSGNDPHPTANRNRLLPISVMMIGPSRKHPTWPRSASPFQGEVKGRLGPDSRLTLPAAAIVHLPIGHVEAAGLRGRPARARGGE